MKHMKVIVVGAVLLVALAADATPQIEVSVSPVYGFEPVTLVVAVVTASHADNRMLRVVAESAGFVTSSDRQLEGTGSPRIARFEFRSVPAGAYDVRATLIGSNGKVRAEAVAPATVISRDF